MKRVLSAALACTALVAPTQALADPISVTILAALGTQTATALAISAVTFALTTAATMVMQKLFAPKMNGQDRQAAVVSLSIGENPREALFGEVGTGGSLSDAFNHGGPDATDWEVLVIVVADHRCHSLTGFYVNDVYVEFSGDGPVAGYNGQLEVYWRPGTEDQVMPTVVTAQGGWAPDDNLAGCATVIVAYKADSPKAKKPIWTAGRPNFLWIVKGKHCYIARKDSTVSGGFGPHRWDDPSTWEWTDNLIDCRYNWMRGIYACDRVDEPGMLLVGRGLSATEAPPERTLAAANLCDELVPLKSGGSEKRYRINAVIRANEEFIDTEEMFAAAAGGIIVKRQGGVEIEPGAARPVVAEITDNDFIVGEPKTYNAFRTDTQRINSVVPRYIEPAQKWADHAAPLRRSLADVVEDGGPREDPLSLIGVTSNTQAQRCGEIKRRLARKERTFTGTLGPRFAHLEEGDWIGFTSARHLKGERHVFRIVSYSLPASWRNTISIEEVSADCYDWNASVDEIASGAVAQQQPVPPEQNYDAPDSADWSLAAGAASVPSIVITGAAPEGVIDNVVFEFRRVGAANWSAASIEPDTVTRKELPVPEAEAAYEAAVRYLFKGLPSERLVLGPVTTGDVQADTALLSIELGGGSSNYSGAAIDSILARLAAAGI